MSEPVFVIQVLSDGNYGFPLDRIVEIGIVKIDIESSTVESVYSERIFLEDGSFTKKQREYLRNISGLDVSDLSKGLGIGFFIVCFPKFAGFFYINQNHFIQNYD